MRRFPRLSPLLLLAAALWLTAAAPVRPSTTDGLGSVEHRAHAGAPHAVVPAMLDVAMAGDEADGEGASPPSTHPCCSLEGLPTLWRDSPSPFGSDPAGTNRASRRALSAHPSTAPPDRI